MRVITLPNGRAVTLGMYVAAWRRLLTMAPDTTVRSFEEFPTDASQVLAAIRGGMLDRINRHIPGYGVGRKWEHQWQSEMRFAARALNTPRLVIDWLPQDLAARFAARLRVNMCD